MVAPDIPEHNCGSYQTRKKELASYWPMHLKWLYSAYLQVPCLDGNTNDKVRKLLFMWLSNTSETNNIINLLISC